MAKYTKKVDNKIYNSGTMTRSQFRSFIISKLRQASMYWKPKNECIARCRVGRGMYKCEMCKQTVPATLPPEPWKKKRKKNFLADHISPIIDPEVGFNWFDSWIERCFVEINGYQGLCWACHKKKTDEENGARS